MDVEPLPPPSLPPTPASTIMIGDDDNDWLFNAPTEGPTIVGDNQSAPQAAGNMQPMALEQRFTAEEE